MKTRQAWISESERKKLILEEARRRGISIAPMSTVPDSRLVELVNEFCPLLPPSKRARLLVKVHLALEDEERKWRKSK